MTNIYVDHARLESAAQDFAQRHEALQTVLTDLEDGLAPMIATWEGSAQSMYLEKKAAWDAAAADLTALLAGITRLTTDAHEGYAATVSANHATWS
jgi:early secretory antigenic target protein ESAT-6